ncbi:MAG: AraC family transcriptional regulator [Bacillota bacterium]|nr:AraC family transcriptional regulator [Bacillota bacterium]
MHLPGGEKPDNQKEINFHDNIFYVPVNTGELLVYYSEIISGTVFEFGHNHPCYEIYYVLKESITMNIKGRPHHLEEGQLALIMPGVTHEVEYEPLKDAQFFVITFEFCPRSGRDTRVRDVLVERFELDTLMHMLKVQDYYICTDCYNCDLIVRRIEAELKNRDIGWSMTVLNLYLQFIINALRNISFRSSYPSYGWKNVNAAIEISKYMHRYFSEDITLKSVADALNMTPRNVSRLFKGYFGTTFGKTLSRFRYNYAKYYLLTTDHPVEEIAKMVGFKSSRTLFKMIKEKEGKTIAEFRARARRQNPI